MYLITWEFFTESCAVVSFAPNISIGQTSSEKLLRIIDSTIPYSFDIDFRSWKILVFSHFAKLSLVTLACNLSIWEVEAEG